MIIPNKFNDPIGGLDLSLASLLPSTKKFSSIIEAKFKIQKKIGSKLKNKIKSSISKKKKI